MFQACGGKAGVSGTPTADLPVTEPPFQNAEPDNYQVEVLQTTAKGVERYFIARKGKSWRVDNAYGDPGQVTSLRTDKDFVLNYATKTYAEYDSGHGYDERARMVEDVTRGMIIARTIASYEKIGTENGMTKYRVTGEPGKKTESIITIDDKLGMPVSKEIYSLEPARTLDVTVKLTGFKTEVDDSLLVMPKDFKKVPLEDMQKTLIGPKPQ